MGVLINCENVHFEYPTKRVLECVSLGVSEGERIGIVGRNGDGKSTLLALLAGTISADSGTIVSRRDLRVGMLSQQDSLNNQDTVEMACVGGMETHEWAGNARTRKIVDALLGDVDWQAKVETLSGGQRRRLDLARLLVGEWDVLALDEPTNHLDMKAISWLADHLLHRWPKGQGGLLLVTHDRWFLDEVCTDMWEVHDGKVDPFEGGYSAYIQQRLERDRQAAVSEEKRQNLLRKELAWLARGPQARGTKPKFRVAEAKALIADEPEPRNTIELKRLAVSRLGKQVVELKGVSKRLGDTTILDDVSWIIGPGDRYAILGANGVGKTTLLNTLRGACPPDKGTVKIGATVRCAILSQRLDELSEHEGETVWEVLNSFKRRYVIDGKEYTAAQLLERLGFDTRQQFARVEDLSGGQRRRLQLLIVLMSEPNLLILDEPGNDMDTDMLAVLEDLLDSWPGTLILVSHDRYLVERVTDDQFVLSQGKITHLPGGVEQFLKQLTQSDPQKAPSKGPSTPDKEQERPASNLSGAEEHQLRKQRAATERKIDSLHASAEAIRQRMSQADPSDFEALGKMQAELDEIANAIDEAELVWLEYTERLGD